MNYEAGIIGKMKINMNKDIIYSDYKKKSDEFLQLRTEVMCLENELAELPETKKVSEEHLVAVFEQKKAAIKKKKKQLEKERGLLIGGDNTSLVRLDSPQIENIKSEIQNLQYELEQQTKKISDEKEENIGLLEADKQKQQVLLQSYMASNLFECNIETFNEKALREALLQEKQRALEYVEREYDRKISEKKQLIQGLSDEYVTLCSRGISDIEADEKINELRRDIKSKEISGELPEIITRALDEPISNFVQRRNITDAQRVARLAGAAVPINSLDKYMPVWVEKIVNYGLPVLLGIIIFVYMIISGFRMTFVATATNDVVIFLIRVFAVCGVGGFAYFIFKLIKRKKAGINAGIIGAIIGLLISLQWKVSVPNAVTDVVEIVVKILICLVVVFAIALLNMHTVVGEMQCNLVMKIGVLKKEAIKQQETEISERTDCYYALLKYKEIIKVAIERGLVEKKNLLHTELNELEKERINALEKQEQINKQNIESRVQSEKRKSIDEKQKREFQKKEYTQRQDAIMLELSSFDEKVQEKIEYYDKEKSRIIKQYRVLIAEKKQELETAIEKLDRDASYRCQRLSEQIKKCEEELIKNSDQYEMDLEKTNHDSMQKEAEIKIKIEQLQEDAEIRFTELGDLFKNLFELEYEEVKDAPVLSDHIYLYREDDEEVYRSKKYSIDLEPVEIIDVFHDKKPIVFLYKDKESVATHLYPIMDAIVYSFIKTSCRKIFKMYIMDPLNEGKKFANHEKEGRVIRINNINKLYEQIKKDMELVAANGPEISIDEWNNNLLKSKEYRAEKYGKYNIVQFIIPREDTPQTTEIFNSAIWTTFETSRQHGFLPIFYISEEDWISANKEEKRGNFIAKLKQVVGFSDNMWILEDADNLKLKKYN